MAKQQIRNDECGQVRWLEKEMSSQHGKNGEAQDGVGVKRTQRETGEGRKR